MANSAKTGFHRAVVVMLSMVLPVLCTAQSVESENPDSYDAQAALRVSQAAIGSRLGDYAFTDSDGNAVRLADYAGKPLVVSMIFSSCYHVCPVTTRRLDKAVTAARDALGDDSFRVVTIGFDTAHDTPDAMRVFAREQGIDARGWDFLSGSAEAVADLIDDLGFVYFPSPRGFDHLVQLTIVDRDSVIYRQVYGEAFELPWLVEPLKDLVFNRPESVGHPLAGLVDRIRIFCTVYDPNTGRYEIDYSLFIQFVVGLIVVMSVAVYLWRESRRARRARQQRGE